MLKLWRLIAKLLCLLVDTKADEIFETHDDRSINGEILKEVWIE
jgi:hypothetical protein